MGGVTDALEGAFDAFPQPESVEPFSEQVAGVEPIGRVVYNMLCDVYYSNCCLLYSK